MSSNNRFGTIIQIGDILVSEDVVTEYFACDYAVCKGCCCIIGDSGAPLEESELEPLEENYPVYSKLMRPRGRAQIDKEGFFSIDRDGDIVTPVVDQTEECAYTTFDENGNCFCSIERCFFLLKRLQLGLLNNRRWSGPEPPSLGNLQGRLR